jgi:hypothetical protein
MKHEGDSLLILRRVVSYKHADVGVVCIDSNIRGKNGGSKYLRNVGLLLRDYKSD